MLEKILLYLLMALYLIQFGSSWFLIVTYTHTRIKTWRDPSQNSITVFKKVVQDYKIFWNTFLISFSLMALIILIMEYVLPKI
jgi:hypothetical protein